MTKIATVILAVIICMFLNLSTAIAAVNTDCKSRGCNFILTNTNGILAEFKDDGTSAGSLTTSVGSGQGTIAAGDGYVSWTRVNSNNVWIYNIASGANPCTANAGTTICGYGNGVVFGSYFYRGCNASVKKIALDCSSIVSIPTQSGAYALTRDSSTIYVLESATVATIVPPAETSTSNSIGRQASDNLSGIEHVGGVLYTAGTAGIYTAPLPLDGTSSLLQALPFATGLASANSGYLACPSLGDVAYLVPIASPNSYISVGCTSCGGATLSDDSLYTVGGWNPDIGVKAWNFAGVERAYSPLTTATSYSIAYASPTVVAPVCGDNVTNGTDFCDGSDLNGEDCTTQGFDYGTLACNAGCSDFDTSACHDNCGNGSIEVPEQCDGGNFNGSTCNTLGFDAGSLACTASCTIDTSGCEMNCGNGSIEAPEDCDGSNLNGETCVDLGFNSGTLACSGTCVFDTTSCVTLTCGNGSIDNGEECDGLDLNGQTCVSLGHDGGALSCSSTSCTFDTSACTDFVCGNGQIEGSEECDGVNLGTATCQSLGLGTGTLSCSGCSFNTSGCDVQPVCGNGVQEGSEECDDNNLVSGDGCDEFCKVEVPPDCGNGTIDTDEDCDGDNLDGQTCVGLGFTGGSLSCNAGCVFNTTGCTNTEVCDYSGVIEEVTTVDHPDLAGNALEKYTSNIATLTRSCQISCVNTDTVQVVAPSGSYCNFKVTGNGYDVIWHMYTLSSHTSPATFRYSISGDAMPARYGGGHILLHDGNDIEFKVGEGGAVIGGTQGTAEMAEFAGVHPDTQTPGNWYIINVLTDTMIYCAPGSATNCAVLAAGKNGRAVLNLDALGDLTQWNLKVDEPPTCNGCNQTSGSSPLNIVLMLVFIGLVIFWLRNRPLVRTRVRVSVSKRR